MQNNFRVQDTPEVERGDGDGSIVEERLFFVLARLDGLETVFHSRVLVQFDEITDSTHLLKSKRCRRKKVSPHRRGTHIITQRVWSRGEAWSFCRISRRRHPLPQLHPHLHLFLFRSGRHDPALPIATLLSIWLARR